jgi:plastocyanin
MFRTFTTTISIFAALILLHVAYGSAAYSAAPQDSDSVVVKMTTDHLFVPDKITIKSGQTVEWVNDEPGGLHEVTDDPDAASDAGDVSMPDGAMPFDSHIIRSGKSFKYQFTIPGVYKYVCPPHEGGGMVGQVTVTK